MLDNQHRRLVGRRRLASRSLAAPDGRAGSRRLATSSAPPSQTSAARPGAPSTVSSLNRNPAIRSSYPPGAGRQNQLIVLPARARFEVGTGVSTARAFVALLSQVTRMVEPRPANHVTRKGAYGIRTRAAAVRGRCPRPLDECARRRPSVATSGRHRAVSLPARTKEPAVLQRVREAAGLGFEPRLLGPEPSVLPLDDPATRRCGIEKCSPVQAVVALNAEAPWRRRRQPGSCSVEARRIVRQLPSACASSSPPKR